MHDDDALMEGLGTDPLESITRRRRMGVKVTAAAVMALGLAIGGGVVAGASTSTPPPAGASGSSTHSSPRFGGSPPAAMGTVKSVGTDTFTLTTTRGTVVTVDVGSTTTYHDPGVTSPTLADVKVGDHVAVFGTDTSNTVTATSVGIGDFPAGGRGGPGGPGGKGGPGRPPSGSGSGGPPSGAEGW